MFDYFDFVTLDAGERPLLALLEHLARQALGEPAGAHLRARRPAPVRYVDIGEPDVPFAEVGTPTWDGLPLDRYLSLLDMLNPMHRLWSDGRWNKLTVAHGCYWKKCSFCDVSLDYISRYDAATADDAGRPHRGHRRRDRPDRLPLRRRGRAAQGAEGAGRRAAAAPAWPSAGGATSASRRRFTPALCQQLADSGCIAISGGLEVASDRLLKLMKKGVIGRAGGARDARPSPTPASWCTPT